MKADYIVTLATTEACELLAANLVKSCERHVGMTPIVLLRRDFPSTALAVLKMFDLPDTLLKCWLPEALEKRGIDAARVLFMDCDTMFLGRVDLFAIAPLGFSACLDLPSERSERDAAIAKLKINEYFNSGLFMFSPVAHNTLLKAAWLLSHYVRFEYPGDQGPLNAARKWLGEPLHILPNIYNWIAYHRRPSRKAIVAHLNGATRFSTTQINAILSKLNATG